MAGETRFEHATYGFGDRYSTVEPLPYLLYYTILKIHCQEKIMNYIFFLTFLFEIYSNKEYIKNANDVYNKNSCK